jgi:prophage antirepressor-like protein
MMSEMRHVGNLKFHEIPFRKFEYEGRIWVPLADLAHGLSYSKPDKLYDLVRENPDLFAKQGWIFDGSKVAVEGELLPRQGSISIPGVRRSLTLFASYEGVIMCLMLNRSDKAEEFKVWAAKRLVPAMIRRAHRETPLDDMTPDQRIAYLREKAKLRRDALELKMRNSPVWNATQLVRETNALYMRLSTDGRDTSAAFSLLTDARELLDALKVKRDGPALF